MFSLFPNIKNRSQDVLTQAPGVRRWTWVRQTGPFLWRPGNHAAIHAGSMASDSLSPKPETRPLHSFLCKGTSPFLSPTTFASQSLSHEHEPLLCQPCPCNELDCRTYRSYHFTGERGLLNHSSSFPLPGKMAFPMGCQIGPSDFQAAILQV